MIEVECKLKIESPDQIEQKLIKLGFVFDSQIHECDTYYDNSDGYIRNHDSALRLRTISLPSGDTSTEINLKGPKYDNTTVTRPEFETKVMDCDTMSNILISLGYNPVAPVVKKCRKTFTQKSMTACLDFVEGLGDYLELEIMVTNESDKEAALREIEDTLINLGYRFSDTTTMSYLSALQKNHK